LMEYPYSRILPSGDESPPPRRAPMGRQATKSGKTTLDLDPKLKERAVVWAVRNGTTLKEMVEEGLRLVMVKGGE
jgi:predicted HicB family RNase H-like nuclease